MFFKLKLILLFFNLINCKQQQTVDFNIFPTDQLCLICRLIIGYWHNQSGDFNNTEQFKNELQKTCSKLLNETEIEKCKNGINLEKLKELETKSIEKICKLEGFCENEFPIIVNERNQLEHEENVKKYLEIPKIEKIENKNKTNTKVNETTIKTTTKKSGKNKKKKGFNEEEKNILKFY